jgi:hypothetical protein
MDLPSERQIRWILRRTAALLDLGAEPVRGLVEPNGAFFPDAFDGSPKSVAALLDRMKEHAGLRRLRTELAVVAPEAEAQGSSCSSGACGGSGKIDARLDRVTRRADGSYAVAVAAGEVRSPVVLTTAFVRSIAFMFMSEAGAYEELEPEEREPATDLAAVLLGFGVLVANGSYIYAKSCGGVSVHSATRLPVGEAALALAVFCKLHQVPERLASKHLDPTPREHFDEAAVWAGSNAPVIRLLRADPEAIEVDDYKLSPARSWLARALGIGQKAKVARASDEEMAELERSLAERRGAREVDPERARRLAEIRALLEEG